MKNRIVIEKYEGSLNSEFIKTLEEILDWFSYSVKFKGSKIYLHSENSVEDEVYTNINDFLNSWIYTCEDAMDGDENIDYSNWINVLKLYLTTP